MKEAVENLLPIERNLFFALNGSDSFFLDNLFWTFTGRYIWGGILLFLLAMFFYKMPRKEGLLSALFLVLIFVVCDQVSSSIFKEIFQRLRPTYHPDFKDWVDTVNDYRGGGFSFISGHATNSFGVAVLFSLSFKNRWVTFPVLIWALLNSYSRIYLGLHFISDIVAGAIMGSFLGWMLYELYSHIRVRFYGVPASERTLSAYPEQSAKIVGVVLSVYVFLVMIFSPLLSALPH